MPVQTVLTQRLGLAHPIIQAPMAGGGDTPALVAAVSAAGGLGSIGAAYLTAEQLRDTVTAVRAQTARPFGVNLFAPLPAPAAPADMAPALARMAPFYAQLGLPEPEAPAPAGTSFDALFPTALDSGAAVLSFTFGLLPDDAVRAVKQRGMLLAGTATTVEEAVALERLGVDLIVAQGAEAGGHRGTFAGPFEAAMVGTMALVPQIVDAVAVPVVASGGIMDGRGIAASLALGACGVQMGTAFLTCAEAGIAEVYKQAILEAREDGTRLTRAFSGRPARGIANRFMDAVSDDAALPFPMQNALTRPLRTAAAKQGRAEFLSLWAGQGVRLARRQTAEELMARLVEETDRAVKRLAG